MSERTTILAVIPDLMFQSRVHEQAQALGFEITTADTMDEAIEEGRLQPGMKLLLVAFGAGLTWGAMAVRW